MLIVTTIYCMAVERASKVSAQKPAEEKNENIGEDGREFLGIYQGRQGQANRE